MRIDLYIRRLTLIYCICNFALFLGAQSSIKNGGFQGHPQDARMPDGWFKCARGTTPDILPGSWGVYLPPAEGQSYLGLIARDDGSTEAIGQRLTKPLKKGQCYTFELDLAHSDAYAGYDESIRIEIYASKKKCKQDQLLFRSPIITQSSWQSYTSTFVATEAWKYITLKAVHGQRATNGNILIDQLTDLNPCRRAERCHHSRTVW